MRGASRQMRGASRQMRGVQRETRGRRWTRSNTILTLVLVGGLLSLRWVRVNIEPSVPVGVYLLHAVRTPLPRGTLVLVPVPARVQQWKSPWTPLLKPVAAVAGETACVRDGGLVIDDENYGRVYPEAGGYRLPHMEGCLTVEEGHIFVASKAYRSLDSRYFGSVQMTEVTARATPLWIWR
jgi:conjugative transfer signal peptidase TraF